MRRVVRDLSENPGIIHTPFTIHTKKTADYPFFVGFLCTNGANAVYFSAEILQLFVISVNIDFFAEKFLKLKIQSVIIITAK